MAPPAGNETTDLSRSDPLQEAHFEAGDLVADRYQVVRFIARGGMGEVYEVQDAALGTRVALKALRAHLVDDDEAADRFRREILLARQVTHPNVCRIFDLAYHRSATGRLPVLTMELLPWRTLGEHLREQGALPVSEALALAGDVAAGLAEAHRRGVVHRDLKSANILIEPGGRVVVTDFGLARSLSGADSMAGSMVGTPAYMAPEQITGGQIGPFTDVYALGVVLYEMITGRLAQNRERGGTHASQIRAEVAHAGGRLPSAWARVIERCLQPDPRDRFASMEDVIAALREPTRRDAPRLGPGARAGRYRILGELEAGLYRARDGAAGRAVTLLMVGAEAPPATRRERLAEELAPLGALAIDAHEDFPFAVLPGGTTLRARLAQARLAPAEALALAAQLTEAVGAAHARGIAVGELRPEEILLAEGRTLLLGAMAARLHGGAGASVRDNLPALAALLADLRRQARGATRRRAWLALPAAALVALGAIGVLRLRPPGAQAPEPHVEYQRLSFHRGAVGHARFAADGRTVVYAAARRGEPLRLYATLPGSREARPLSEPGVDVAALSPGGELALLRGDVLARMALAGAAPRDVDEHVAAADWTPAGDLAVVRVEPGTGRRTIELPLGKPVYTTSAYLSALRVSPAGDRVAFVEHPIPYDDTGRIGLVGADGKATFLGDTRWGAVRGVAWRPDGAEIWFWAFEEGSRGGIYAVTPAGALRRVLSLPMHGTLLDLGAAGALFAFDDVDIEARVYVEGEPRPRNLSWLDYTLTTDISTDGGAVVFAEGAMGASSGDYDTYVRTTDGKPAVHLGPGFSQRLSPDGRWVMAFVRDGTRHRLTLLPTGAGQPRELPRGPITSYSQVSGDFFPDGKSVAVAGKAGGDWQVWRQDLDGRPPVALTPEGWRVSRWAIVHPDGDRLLVVDARGEWFLRSIATGEAHPIPGYDPKMFPARFVPDGSALLVMQREGATLKVGRLDLSSGALAPLRELVLDADLWTGPWITPDAKTIALSVRRLQQSLYLISGI